jgi:hypothetical protein
MAPTKVRAQLIRKGEAPLCLKTHQQCRGCFGWRNMIGAAQSQPAWQDHPLRCLVTGLTIQYGRLGSMVE